MTLEEFLEKLKTEKITDYIVRLKYKYNFEKEYTYSNELLLINHGIDYEWNNDWIEGQTDIEVLEYIAVDDVLNNIRSERKDAEKSIMQRAIDVYGAEKQLIVAAEECSELIKAITKVLRVGLPAGSVALENVVEEVADVSIVLDEIKQIFQIEADVEEVRAQKIERLNERLFFDKMRNVPISKIDS